MSKQLTIKEAWLYLAELWDKPQIYGDDVPYAVLRHDLYSMCLCHSVTDLWHAGLISLGTGRWMKGIVLSIPRRDGSAFRWARDIEGARQRAAFCREQAALCIDEQTPVEASNDHARTT